MGLEAATILGIVGIGASLLGTAAQASASRSARRQAEQQAAQQQAALQAARAAPEPVLPRPDDEAVRRARKRSITAQLLRRGRASTILTQPSFGDTLGA